MTGASGGRPYVTMNVAATVDGKLAPVGGGKVSFGGAEDRALMERLRAEADAVLIGGGTLRDEDPPLVIRDPEVAAARLAAKGSAQPLNVAVCSVLPAGLAGMAFFREPATERVVVTTDRSPPADREAAARVARVVVVGRDESGRVEVREAVRALADLGVRRLLLEGGGELNFSMLRADLVDEVRLTLCPFAFGGRSAPTPFDGEGFPRDQVRRLALRDHRVGAGGVLFLRYDVLPGAAPVTDSPLFPGGFEIRAEGEGDDDR